MLRKNMKLSECLGATVVIVVGGIIVGVFSYFVGLALFSFPNGDSLPSEKQEPVDR